MFKTIKYLLVGIAVVSLGGCFVPYGVGGYYGGGDDDDSLQTVNKVPHASSVDYRQDEQRVYRAPYYWGLPSVPYYQNDPRHYYRQDRQYASRRDYRQGDEYRDGEDDHGDN